MEQLHYTSERNAQILIALMKAHGVRKVIVSPGSTNICFAVSLQHDPFFELYSCVDERSAAYMACGLAEESGEPVVLSCTGATASRNYIPGLTEAFYRKLPVLAVTSTRPIEQIGHNIPQVMDRTNPLNDIAKMSVYLHDVNTASDEWGCTVNANKALLELQHRGGGPVHVNLMTTYSDDFSVEELPDVRVIKRYEYCDELPDLPAGTTAIYVGAHSVWSKRLTDVVDRFCEAYNAVVLAEPMSNYKGKYGLLAGLLNDEKALKVKFENIVHIGNNTCGYPGFADGIVWRVNSDGELRDSFSGLTAIFEMTEEEFFERMCDRCAGESSRTTLFSDWLSIQSSLVSRVRAYEPNMPFCNIWAASQSVGRIPEGAALHLAILNSVRSWSYFDIPKTVDVYCNTGGFGIDGCTSTLIGASLANPDRQHFIVTGDLAQFYDLNSLGNRHVGPNVRIMMINNGLGAEFKLKQTLSMRAGMGETADAYIAAAGHFGGKSPALMKNFVENLGYEYFSASGKGEFLCHLDRFFDPSPHERPMFFELFVDPNDDVVALDKLRNLETSAADSAKRFAKSVIGGSVTRKLKRIIGK